MSLNLDFSSVSLTWWASSALGLKGHFMTHSPRHHTFSVVLPTAAPVSCWCTETIHISRTPPAPPNADCAPHSLDLPPDVPLHHPPVSHPAWLSLSLSDGLMVRWCVWCPCAKGTHLSQLASRCDCLGCTDNTWGGVSAALLVWVCFSEGAGVWWTYRRAWSFLSCPLILCLTSLHWANTSVEPLVLYVFIICTVTHPASWCVLRNHMVIACVCVSVYVFRLFFSSQLYFILYPYFSSISIFFPINVWSGLFYW